jgi:hypothetical protein
MGHVVLKAFNITDSICKLFLVLRWLLFSDSLIVGISRVVVYESSQDTMIILVIDSVIDFPPCIT